MARHGHGAGAESRHGEGKAAFAGTVSVAHQHHGVDQHEGPDAGLEPRHVGSAVELDAERRADLIERSPLSAAYTQPLDRESAYEMLAKREAELTEQRRRAEQAAEQAAFEEKQRKASSKSSRGRCEVGRIDRWPLTSRDSGVSGRK